MFWILLLISAVPGRSQKITAERQQRIASVIRRQLARDGTPSASVAVVLDGQLAYAESYGKMDLSLGKPASIDTSYQLASLSKMFVAQAILELQAAGLLTLDEPISRWLPRVSGANEVTLRQLLAHTAGYPDFYPQSYPAGPRSREITTDQIIDGWATRPLLFKPGSRFHYSNLDYVLAGRIVEKVSGDSLFSFMEKRIFAPLKMSSTRDLDTIGLADPSLATGYVEPALAALRPAPAEGKGWNFGAGQVVATASDVARWDAALLQQRLLPTLESQEQIEPVTLADGSTAPTALGLFVSHSGGYLRYYHTGQGQGFITINIVYPEAHAAFVVLTNTSVHPTATTIALELAYLFVPPTANDLAARTIFQQLQQGRPDRSRLSDDLNQFLDESYLAAYRSSLSRLGEPRSLSLISESTAAGLETRTYEIVMDETTLDMTLLLLPDGKVEDITITRASQ